MKKFGELIGEASFLGMDDEIDAWTRRDEIFAKTRQRLKDRTTAEWLELFRANDIWSGPVYGYMDLIDDPQVKHNGTFITYNHSTEGEVMTPGFPIRFSRTPSAVARGAPLAGEHTREILSEIGFSDNDIERLITAKAIGETRS